MHRAIPWRKTALNRAAGAAGRTVGSLVRTGPGLLGAGLITLGAGAIYWPLACFVGGAFLLVLDHRTTV